jgi:death-on-curing protein
VTEPVWIEAETLLALHERSLSLHGGANGLRDKGLLDSALARPRNNYLYEGVKDVADLAAIYAVGIASNHPFVDGNKRAAFASLLLFLALNGRRLAADRVDATRVMLSVAAGETEVADLSAWIRRNS